MSTVHLQFDDVAVNDIPVYRRFHIKNADPIPLQVQLASSTPLICFQLLNENYESLKRVGAVNFLSVYNEAFDSVGQVSSLELAQGEERDIIVSFRADCTTFSNITVGTQPVSFTGIIQLVATRMIDKDLQDSDPLRNGGTATSAIESADSENNTALPGLADNMSLPHRSETLAVPFRVNVYLSYLKVSSTEIQVTMAPNKTQIVDFLVTNTSCQPLYFVVRSQAMSLRGLMLSLYEADKFEDPKLGHRILLDSYASMNFSLMVRTATESDLAPQYQVVLQCDNLKDNRNTSFINVTVNVVAESQGDLVAFPDTSINFGDVYRGTKVTANLQLQNIDGREDAVISMGDFDRWKCEGKLSLMKGDATVDELVIPAQKGNPLTSLTVLYQPTYNAATKEASKKKFDIEFLIVSSNRTRVQRAVIRCAVVLYISSIGVSQRCVNFGDCQVGQCKRYTLQIENHSPLPGKVFVQLRSKVLRIEGVNNQKGIGREIKEEFFIGPLSSLPVTLRITPQRVNPTYRKQLIIVNASSPMEDRQVINIEANNMAPLEAKLHDELYSWRCDMPNYDMGSDGRGFWPSALCAISGLPLLVPYSVQSKVDYDLVLNIRSSSPEIELFYSTDAPLCERFNSVSNEIRSFCVYGENEDSSHLTKESAEKLFRTREELLRLLSETSQNITNRLVLEPKAQLKAYVLIIRTSSPMEPQTKEDGISIAVDGIEIPRFVRLSYRLCGTSFELNGQMTKNFGDVNIGVKKVTKLPIVNRCNSFLFLRISKSRSVTAGHIRMEGSDKQSIFLTIRPYAMYEVELTLYPGIKGTLEEKICVTNVINIQNSVVMTLKAFVTKADTFEISPDSWSFDVLLPGSTTNAAAAAAASPPGNTEDGVALALAAGALSTRAGAKFTVSNTSTTRRQIIVRVDTGNNTASAQVTTAYPFLNFPGVRMAVQLDMMLSSQSSGSSRKLEEQIEKLEQKLKIYIRKKKLDKVENATKKIEAYRLALKGEEVDLALLDSNQAQGSTDQEFSESEDDSAMLQPLRGKMQQCDVSQLLRREGVPLPSMGAGESVMITLLLHCIRVGEDSIPASQTHTLNLLFYEAKDQEANRIVPIDVTLLSLTGDASPSPGVGSTAVSGKAITSNGASMTGAAPLPASVSGSVDSLQRVGEAASSTPASISPIDAPVLPPTTSTGNSTSGSPTPTPLKQSLISLTPEDLHHTSAACSTRASSTFMGHPLLVLRNCIVNDLTEFSFRVETNADTTIVVLEPRRCGGTIAEALDARFKLFPRNGRVHSNEPLRIVVECVARSVGPQRYFIPVKNIQNASDVRYLTVEMNPTEEMDMLTTEPKELIFSDVITPCSLSMLEAQVVSIRSRFPFPHALLVRTNKPSQLSIYEDAACTVPLTTPIQRIFMKETVRVYVQLRPGARYNDAVARWVRAGVLVEALAPNIAFSPTAYSVIGKAVLRATACVGSGLVEVVNTDQQLGCVAANESCARTRVSLCNTSHSFPLRLTLLPSSPLVVLEEVTPELLILSPLEVRHVSVVIHLPSPGLFQECVEVVNSSCAQPPIPVYFTVLRLHPDILQMEPTPNTPLHLPLAAVVRGEHCNQLHLHRPVSCRARLVYTSSMRDIVLATRTSRLPLQFHTIEDDARVMETFEEQQRELHSGAGVAAATPTGAPPSSTVASSADGGVSFYAPGRVGMRPHVQQTVVWTLTALPELSDAEVADILAHRLVVVSAIVQVCVAHMSHATRSGFLGTSRGGRLQQCPTVGQCVLLVPLTVSLAMSEGRAEPAIINLGLVGKAEPLISTTESSASSCIASDNEEEGSATEGEACDQPSHQTAHDVSSSPPSDEKQQVGRGPRTRIKTVSDSAGQEMDGQSSTSTASTREPKPHDSSQERQYRLPLGCTVARRAAQDRRCCHRRHHRHQRNSNTSMAVSLELINLSSVMPLPLKVECPPVIQFRQSRLTIPPGGRAIVDAALDLRLIQTQGSFRYAAFFVNEWNPENDMAVYITGQHYWKVFQVVRQDTQEEVRDSLTLPPLRVESSLSVPLTEIKLSVTATEPDVELNVHWQRNPQLDGLVDVLLLHYDATSTVEHLSFHSDPTPSEPHSHHGHGSANPTNGGGGNAAPAAMATTVSSTSAQKGPGVMNGLSTNTSVSGTGLPSPPANQGGLNGTAALSHTNISLAAALAAMGGGGAGGTTPVATTTSPLPSIPSNAAISTAPNSTTINFVASFSNASVCGNDDTASIASAVPSVNLTIPNSAAGTSNLSKNRRAVAAAAASANGGIPSAPSPAGAAASPAVPAAAAAATSPALKSQTLRLRCVLRGGDLTSLISLFYRYKKPRVPTLTPQASAPISTPSQLSAGLATSLMANNGGPNPTTTTTAVVGGPSDLTSTDPSLPIPSPLAASALLNNAGVPVVWTYDRVCELGQRSAALLSNSLWLGTYTIANPFTDEEEMPVYGTLDPFRTFSSASKLTLRPCRVATTSATTPSSLQSFHLTMSPNSGVASANVEEAEVGYIGELAITNDFEMYEVELTVAVVVSDRMPVPVRIDLRGGRKMSSVAAGSTPIAGSGVDDEDRGRPALVSAAEPKRTEEGTPARSSDAADDVVLTSFTAAPTTDGVPPSSQAHRLCLMPRETAVVTVLIRSAASSSGAHFSLSSLDQFVSVALVDENVPFSFLVTRVCVAPSDAGEAAPPCVMVVSPEKADLPTISTSSGQPSPVHSPQPLTTQNTEGGYATANAGGDSYKVVSPATISPNATAPIAVVVPQSFLADGVSTPDPATTNLTAVMSNDSTDVSRGDVSTALEGHSTAAVAPPRRWVLSLGNCDPVSGCSGSYASQLAVTRDDTCEANITITNQLADAPVRYTAQVVSQSPQVWLLLTSSSSVLDAGATQPLRLQILSSDVGSFVAYISIVNSHDPREVVFLRLSAEVFFPGVAEGLFDIVALNGGHRLSTRDTVHMVELGALYGADSCSTRIAVDLHNRGNVALEFPVSVVHPFRQWLRLIPDRWNRGYEGLGEAPSLRDGPLKDGTALWTPSTALADEISTTSVAASVADEVAQHGGRWSDPTATSLSLCSTPRPLRGSTPNVASIINKAASSGGHPPVSAGGLLAPSTNSFDGSLVVCPMQSAMADARQKYFVVNPRSSLRLIFVLRCRALRDIPDGYGVFGEADVVLKCRQSRDTQLTFKTRFEAYQPTFIVTRDYDMDALERERDSAATSPIATTRTTATSALGGDHWTSFSASSQTSALRPPSSRWGEARVQVWNRNRHTIQSFLLVSQSEVLTLTAVGGGTGDTVPGAGAFLLPSANEEGGTTGGAAGFASSAEVAVPPQSFGVFIVRLDRLRAEALLNFDKDESSVARPALCEHAFLYNKANPRERVQLFFHQRTIDGNGGATAAHRSTNPWSAAMPDLGDVKPVKSGGQYLHERHLLNFVQRFSAVLTSCNEHMLLLPRADEPMEGNSSGMALSGTLSGGAGPMSSMMAVGSHCSVADSPNSTTASLLATTAGSGGGGGGGGSTGASGVDRHRVQHLATRDQSGGSTTTTSTSSDEDDYDSGDAGAEAEMEEGRPEEREDVGETVTTVSEASCSIFDVPTVSEAQSIVDGGGDLAGALTPNATARPGHRQRSPLDDSARAAEVVSCSGGGNGASRMPPSHPHHSMPSLRRRHQRYLLSRCNVERLQREEQHVLHCLLLELTWLVDELLFYTILLRNSRHIEARCTFLVAAVTQHPVMVAWRRRRKSLQQAREYGVFSCFMETLEALPRTISTSSSTSTAATSTSNTATTATTTAIAASTTAASSGKS